MKLNILISGFVLCFGLNALAKDFDKMPILSRPASCISSILISPPYGKDRNKQGQVVQFDYRYYQTKQKALKILKAKGYIDSDSIGCDSAVDSSDFVSSSCFGTTNYYLSIYAGYYTKKFFPQGYWPSQLVVNVVHNTPIPHETGNPPSTGYYYSQPALDLPKFQSNTYYDALLLSAVSKVPNCKDLKLQKIVDNRKK